MKRLGILLLISLACCAAAMAQEAPRWMSLDDTLRVEHLLSLAWQNPVIKQFSQASGESHAGGGFVISDEESGSPLDIQRGDYSRMWHLAADTHIKHNASTLWGFARYENGFTDGITWNETSDIDIIYPVVLADSVRGASVKTERYSFGGGYAHGNGHFLLGGLHRLHRWSSLSSGRSPSS